MTQEDARDSIAGDIMAMQVILVSVLQRLAQSDPQLAGAIKDGLDDAANKTENIAIKFGKAPASHHTIKALRIVENLRSAILR